MNLTFTTDVSLAPRQFTIRPELTATGNDIHVRAHPDLGIFDILDASGARIGLLMGFPIDLQDRCVLSGPLTVAIPASSEIDAAAEAILDRLGGRFLLLLTLSGESRVYPDCAAQVPWDYIFKSAASTGGAEDSAKLHRLMKAARIRRYDD